MGLALALTLPLTGRARVAVTSSWLSTLSTRSSRALTEVSRRRDDGDAHRRGA